MKGFLLPVLAYLFELAEAVESLSFLDMSLPVFEVFKEELAVAGDFLRSNSLPISFSK